MTNQTKAKTIQNKLSKAKPGKTIQKRVEKVKTK
jgi:hypothetical protein